MRATQSNKIMKKMFCVAVMSCFSYVLASDGKLEREDHGRFMPLTRSASEGDMRALGAAVQRRFAYSPRHPSLLCIWDLRNLDRSSEETYEEFVRPPVSEGPFSPVAASPRAGSAPFSPKHHDWEEGQRHHYIQFANRVSFGHFADIGEKPYADLTPTEQLAQLIIRGATLVGITFTHEQSDLAKPVFTMRLGDDMYVVVNPDLRPT